MNIWKRKDWQMKPNKASNGWHTQVNPKSRRFMTPDSLTIITDESSKPEGNEVDTAVDSTAIKAYTWNPETKSLFITYTSGDTEYEFPNVPEEYVRDLDNAPSKGHYVATVIKPQFSINR
jgi:GH18 family chitinase